MDFSEQEFLEFKAEALDLLETAEKSLMALDSGAEFKTSFDSVFRGLHNLKGAAGMMELLDLQHHTHELETLLMGFKAQEQIPKPYIDLFLRGIDAARTLLDGQPIEFDYSPKTETTPMNESSSQPSNTETNVAAPAEAAQPALPQDALGEFFSECEEIVDRVSAALEQLEKPDLSPETRKNHVDATYRDVHSLKGAAFLFSIQSIGEIGHAMESSLEPVRDGTHSLTPEHVTALFQCLKAIEAEAKSIQATGKSETNSQKITNLTSNLTQHKLTTNAVEASQDSAPPASGSGAPPASGDSNNTSIRVPVALLDNLMTLMGEMVLVRNQVLQFSNKTEDLEFLNLSKRLNVVTSEIQEEMMKTRMQPIGNVLSKFNRIVRDLSQDLKKNIHLTLTGTETELDKSLLEAVKDPLTHIVRNSCDHGIETPEKRRAAGKPETGQVSIRAYHEGGQVVIEITDDGKGLNKAALIKKAIEKNILNANEAAKLSDKEVFNLIFAPGFSTAEKITNVSGRGVGMDVVRTNIEKIGGTVDLSSVEGKGMTIKIKIPLTLAIIPALVVSSASNLFAIPQVNLVELVRVEANHPENKIETLQGTLVYRLRGNILPLVDLRSILGHHHENQSHHDHAANIAVVNTDHCTFGLIVDAVQDTADIVVKPINRILKSLQVYSGATIMGDGSVALILDIMGISKVAQLGKEKDPRATSRAQRSDNALTRAAGSQDYLLVRLNSPTKHGIVLGYVHRLEEFKMSQIEWSGTQKVIRYRNVLLPIISANDRLNYAKQAQGHTSTHASHASDDLVQVVVIEKAGSLYGIEVNEILDTLTTSIELDTTIQGVSSIFGHLNTPEELVVVVDPFELISPSREVSAREMGSAAGPSSSAWKNMKKMRVLVAEDTAFFQRLLNLLLTKAGHEVVLASDGQQALDILKQSDSPFELVISDIEMPKMNGFEFARAVRTLPRYQHVPMLAVSSRADDKYRQTGLQAGFDLYMEKLKPDMFLDSIYQLIQNTKRAA